MSAPAFINLQPVVYRDTWDGLSNCSFTSDGTAFASALSTVRMHFRDADGNIGLQLTTPATGITITNAANWQFTVQPIASITLTEGPWYWSIEATDASARVKTYVSGMLPVILDATQ
jgi:hypothetical protein